jgi:hypothetical protein
MGNISKNLNSVEFISAKALKEQGKGMFNVDNEFSHSEEDVTIQLVQGKRADWPMALIVFSDVRKLVAVSSLPKDLLTTKADKVTLAVKEIRCSFTKGQIALA